MEYSTSSFTDRKAVAREMREVAERYPRFASVEPPATHYRALPDGVSLCFTFDLRPPEQGGPTYHLSLSRPDGPPAPEEVVDAWVEAFFGSDGPVWIYKGVCPNVVHVEAPSRRVLM